MSAPRYAECNHDMVGAAGENVCIKCGMVEDDSNIDYGSAYGSSPAPSLYLSQSVGTGGEIPKGGGTAAVRRYFRGGLSPQKNLSRFSNACQKLRLHKHVEQDAWRVFVTVSKKMPRKAAEHACVAIFLTCRSNGVPIPKDGIIEAVRTSFGRKSMPTMAKMIYQHMHVLVYDGSKKGEGEYYFNVALNERTAGRRIPESRYVGCKQNAWFLFTKTYSWDDSYKRRARRAVDHAFGTPARNRRPRW